ncbi:MAG: hypothetical protein HKN15_13400, partial [Xanthomonadales bacterium]|nr:hypothetical protein [Xanthomonadales bacterium]
VLDGAFTRLEFSNSMRGSDGAGFEFRAHGYYRPGEDGVISGTWLDSRGVRLPLSGTSPDDFTLRIEWGSAETEQGRTEYRIDGDRLQVVDEVLLPDGAWRVFGRSELQRVQ